MRFKTQKDKQEAIKDFACPAITRQRRKSLFNARIIT